MGMILSNPILGQVYEVSSTPESVLSTLIGCGLLLFTDNAVAWSQDLPSFLD